jgi:hypothetical protein
MFQETWRRITATRYTRALEGEVVRLRAENRALLNSILGVAGVPPIPVETLPLDPGSAKPGSFRGEDGGSKNAATQSKPGLQRVPATPMRKRSWQQINRMLEFESARKKPVHEGEALGLAHKTEN